jgi:hypothetical protein
MQVNRDYVLSIVLLLSIVASHSCTISSLFSELNHRDTELHSEVSLRDFLCLCASVAQKKLTGVVALEECDARMMKREQMPVTKIKNNVKEI